jgi:hypothetical protein
MEEMLGNVAGARQIFERWMKWEPDHNGWSAYIKASSSTPASHCSGIPTHVVCQTAGQNHIQGRPFIIP